MWSRLRKDFRKVVIRMRKEDGKSLVIAQGLQPLRHLTVSSKVKCVTYVAGRHCLVAVDCAGKVCRLSEDGKVCSQAKLSCAISGLLFASGVQRYVAWNQQGLVLLDQDFIPLSQCHVTGGVHCCVYHPGKNVVLSAAPAGVSIWGFAHNGHTLVWQQSLSQEISNLQQVHIIALDTECQNPRTCLAACGTSVWEFHLMDRIQVRLRKNLHSRTITSLVFSENVRLLISGSRDCTIKVWGAEGQLMAVFVGHTGAITTLSLSAPRMTLSSGSEDGTMRMWDLNTHEQTKEVQLSGPPIGIVCFGKNGEHVLCYSNSDIHIWQIQQLYQFHCLVGTMVKDMKVTGGHLPGGDLPGGHLPGGHLPGGHLPTRAVCVCSDGTLRLLSAVTGDLISALSLERYDGLLAADYCIIRETVCVLLKDGQLLKANALVNPMSVQSKKNVSSDHSHPLCFTLYSNIMDAEVAIAEWKQVVKQHGDKGPPGIDTEIKNRFFPIIGSDDGTLSVCDWYSCRPLCQTKAHSPSQVTSLTCDPKNNFIMSAGSDLTVKVWKFFAHTEESLTLCMSFFCSQPVGRMCTFKSQLFVAFNDPSKASYSLVQYCLRTEARKDHPPTDDHQDQITGLCCCPELRLLATCGSDGQIRVWNYQNQLIRTLCLNATPESLAFVGDCGDLLVGMHSHLYRINLAKLLPKSYQVKILCMAACPPAVTQPPVYEDKSLLPDDERNLPQTCSLLLKSLHTDKCGTWKTEQQEQEYILLSSRDQELHLIREGKLRPHKKLKNNIKTKREAMEQYLQLIYKQKPRIIIPEDDYVALNETPPARTADNGLDDQGECRRGFFDSTVGFSFDSLPRHLQASFSSIGAIPNSAILQLLWPMEIVPCRQAEEMRVQLQKTIEKPVFKNIPSVEEEKEVAEMEVEEAIEDAEESNHIPSILQKMEASLKEEPSPVSDPLPSPPPIQRHEEKRTPLPQRPIISRIPRPRPQATKPFRQIPASVQPNPPDLPASSFPNLTRKASPPSPDVDTEDKECPLETSIAVPKTSPFILQFQDECWFSRIFSGTQVEHAEFEARLLHEIVHMESPMRIELIQALQMLYQQGQLRDPKGTFQTLMGVIIPGTGSSMKEEEDLNFHWLRLHFLIQLSGGRRELVLEILVTSVQTHPSHRSRFLSLLKDIGVEDPHGYIGRQVTTWDSWEHTQGDREILKRTCDDWLDSWTGRLMDYLHAAMTRDTNPQKSRRDHRKAPAALPSQGLGTDPPHLKSFHVTPSDVLNYFCEFQMRTEIQTLREADLAERSHPAKESTVLALPPVHRKRALLRLGESMKYSQQRDRQGVSLPPIPSRLLPDVIPFINLPVRRISINPFTHPLDHPGTARLTGSLTQEAHQYFILQHSYWDSYQ